MNKFIKLYFSDLLKILYLSISGFYKSKIGYRDIVRVILTQIYFTSLQAIPLVIMLSIFMGFMMTYYYIGEYGIFDFSFSQNNILFLIIIQQIIPLLTSFLIIARSCTAIASELGNMKVNKEILALESLGISQVQYIIAPRFFAGIASVLTLSFCFSLIFLCFFMFFSILIVDNFDLTSFLKDLVNDLSAIDIIIFIIKNMVIGGFIFLISSLHGLSVSVFSTQVPIATIKAVVGSIIFCVLASAFFTVLNLLLSGVL